MYQALYRKYRSQTFGEMVGQKVISTTLRQAVESGKISHAYLFSGPRGTGKTSAAKIFAKAMNCPNQVNGEPCNHCDICRDITNGSLEDVIEIDAASNNGVDEIREIRDKSTYAPSRATYKVYIIDEVHMLSTGAFNALLKTLEEPTENVVFILATTELHKIPATILSRVQRFEFKAIKQAAIKEHLASILKKEGMTFDDEALTIIARRAEGGMRDALSILDQALSLSSDNNVSQAVAEEITGSIGLTALDSFVANVRNQETSQALSNLETLFDNGKSMSRFATDLLEYFRDLLIVKAGGENSHHSPLFEENLSLEQDRLFQLIDLVTSALPEIKTGTHPKIYAEMLTIKLSETHTQVSQEIPGNLQEELDSLRHEVEGLRKALKEGKVQGEVAPTRKAKPAYQYKVDREKILTIMRETMENPQKSRQCLDALKATWPEILDSISPQNRALLNGSEPVLANQENAILAFNAAFNAELVMKRSDLNDMFGNIMSSAAGFSPNIMAVPKAEFEKLRTEFARSLKSKEELEKETKVEIISIDLTNEENCKEIHNKVQNVDLLINNAGFGDCGDFTKTSLEKDINMIKTNIIAYHILTKLYLKDMKEKNKGKILNVASIAGFMPGPLMATYYATKSYVVRLSESIREELIKEKSNVKISILCPGPVETNFNKVANVKFHLREANSIDVAQYAINKVEKGKFYIVPGIDIKLAKIGAKLTPANLVSKITYKVQKRKITNK